MSYRGWKFTVLLLAPAALAAGGLSMPGFAQESAALEEIVVTAQRRETELQETPVAITVFSGDKIEDLGIFDVSDISGPGAQHHRNSGNPRRTPTWTCASAASAPAKRRC